MTNGQMKEIIRNRCGNSPVLTNAYITSLIRTVCLDLSNDGIFKETYEITLTQGTKEYELPQGIIKINEVQYGSSDDFDNKTFKVVSPLSFKTLFKDNNDNNKQIPYIVIDFDPETGYLLNILYNGLNEIGLLSLLTNDDNQNEFFNPVISAAVIDGTIAYYKMDFEKNPTASAAMEKYYESRNSISSIYDEKVEFP